MSLVIREANNDGRKALKVLREHYQGKGKPRIIALYTELTSLHMGEGETTTDYTIRAETAATSLKAAGEVISDGLLVAMTLKGLPTSYRTFATIVMQKETPMTFSEFKVALRNHEENERCCNNGDGGNTDGVMSATNGTNKPNKFQGKCFKCGRKGHRSSDCYSKKVADKWCQRCKNNSHNTKDCRKGNSDATAVSFVQNLPQMVDSLNESNSAAFTFYQSLVGSVQSSQQTQIMYDTYALGARTPRELSEDEFSALAEELRYVPDSKKVTSYTRIKKGKEVFHSSAYMEVSVRNNYTV